MWVASLDLHPVPAPGDYFFSLGLLNRILPGREQTLRFSCSRDRVCGEKGASWYGGTAHGRAQRAHHRVINTAGSASPCKSGKLGAAAATSLSSGAADTWCLLSGHPATRP